MLNLKFGLILAYGVTRDGDNGVEIPAGSERLIESTCIRKMMMHAGVEIITIVLLGGCDDEGQILRAITGSLPSKTLAPMHLHHYRTFIHQITLSCINKIVYFTLNFFNIGPSEGNQC